MLDLRACSSSARSCSPSTSASTTTSCCDRGGIGRVFTHPGEYLGRLRQLPGSSSHSDDFWQAFRNTTWYAIGVVPAQTITGLDAGGAGEPQDPRHARSSGLRSISPRSAPRLSSRSSSSGCIRRAVRSTYVLQTIGFADPAAGLAGQSQGVIEILARPLGIDNVPTWLQGRASRCSRS